MFTSLKRRLRKHRKLFLKLGPVLGIYRNAVMRTACRFGGIDPELAVFCAYTGKSYNDSPRYISEALHEVRPQTKIVWLMNDGTKHIAKWNIPPYVTVYDRLSFKGLTALARARVAVDNFSKNFYLAFPDKRQIYLFTWHADRAFKKVGFDHENFHSRLVEQQADVIMTGSDYGDMQARSAFHYSGRLLRAGLPRNDILLRDDPAGRAEIRRKLGADGDVRLLLYAPTFRDSTLYTQDRQEVGLDLSRALDTLERTTGQRWRCLLRAHYLTGGIAGAGTDARMTDVTAYPEMAELLCAADALLTDYSSCAGDFILTRRPVYIYQDDPQGYISRDRALYFDMEESPYLVAHTPDELDALIEGMTEEKARENDEAILAFYGTTEREGNAAEIAAKYLAAHLGRENIALGGDAGLPDDDLTRPLTGSGRWHVPYFDGKPDERRRP